jgi:mRNA interferase RelE/StbE
MCSIK